MNERRKTAGKSKIKKHKASEMHRNASLSTGANMDKSQKQNDMKKMLSMETYPKCANK